MKEIEQKINQLKEQLKIWAVAYYNSEENLVSDQVYDAAYQNLLKLEAENPQLQMVDSPTQKVGAPIPVKNIFKKVKHQSPMLSLDNSYNFEELSKWATQAEITSYLAELKIDGASLSLIYENGCLKQAISRGDGVEGEDITNNVKTIADLPHKIAYSGLVEVRGEVYLKYSNFASLEEQGFANPRNVASGSLRLLDPELCRARKLSCFVYEVLGLNNLCFQQDKLNWLLEQNFPVNQETKLFDSIEKVFEYCNYWEENKTKLDYPVDGMVIKFNDLKEQANLGSTNKFPRWATAYKFKAEVAETQIIDIKLEIGRTGALTPVACLQSVQLAGTTVSRASLHNPEQIKRLDARIGDFVMVRKAGEIIPEITKVVLAKRPEISEVFAYPNHCPACGTILVKEDAVIRCPNTKACPAQIKKRIEHWASRSAMNIKGLGEAVVNKLIDQKLIQSISDLYTLQADQMVNLEGFKQKSVENLLQAIANSKKNSLDKFIFGLGIRHIGLNSAKLLADHFGNLQALQEATLEDLNMLEGIGEISARELKAFFEQAENLSLINELTDLGLNPQAEKTTKENHKKQTSYVITGTFAIPRTEIEDLITKAGGKILQTISNKTDFLVCGEKAGSKLSKAQKLQIQIINLGELNEILNQ